QHLPIDAYAFALGQMIGQPRGRPRHVGLPGTHQRYARALQIVLGLLPVATVGPEAGVCAADYQRTRRTIKTAEPLPALPALWQVLRQMRIGGGNDAGMYLARLHGRAQGLDTLNRIRQWRRHQAWP